MSDSDKVDITRGELRLAITVAVQEKRLDILVADFQRARDDTVDKLNSISSQIDEHTKAQTDFMASVPAKMKECRDELEEDLLLMMKEGYVTKDELILIKTSIRNWIAGFTACLMLFSWVLTKTTWLGG